MGGGPAWIYSGDWDRSSNRLVMLRLLTNIVIRVSWEKVVGQYGCLLSLVVISIAIILVCILWITVQSLFINQVLLVLYTRFQSAARTQRSEKFDTFDGLTDAKRSLLTAFIKVTLLIYILVVVNIAVVISLPVTNSRLWQALVFRWRL